MRPYYAPRDVGPRGARSHLCQGATSSFRADGIETADAGRQWLEIFTGGTVDLEYPASGCTNQYYAVSATLGNVSFGSTDGGSGSFSGTLTHYRELVFGYCVTYSAKIPGTLWLTSSG